MTQPWRNWSHITKIDPDKELADGDTFEDVCATGTDALEIGGTLDMTSEKMNRVIDACTKYNTAVYQEPSNPAVVSNHNGLDGYFIPTVLNSGVPAWIVGAHKEWVRMDSDIEWENTHTEGYIVLNPSASVATYTEANCELTAEDVGAFAETGEKMLGQDIIYLEYSGTLGDPDMVKSAQESVDDATIFYGGGIETAEDAATFGEYADTIVVGNLLHEKGADAVAETVSAVK